MDTNMVQTIHDLKALWQLQITEGERPATLDEARIVLAQALGVAATEFEVQDAGGHGVFLAPMPNAWADQMFVDGEPEGSVGEFVIVDGVVYTVMAGSWS